MNYTITSTSQDEALNHLQQETPDAVKAIVELGQFAQQPSALDTKTKALLTLVLAIQSQQMECIEYHVKNALAQQVNLSEMKDLVHLCAYMAGGPGMMAAEKALLFFEKRSKE